MSSRLLSRSNSEITSSLSRKTWTSELNPDKPKLNSGPTKVAAIVYYLTKNGQLQHPHFIEVPLSNHGLYLRDFVNRLNAIRGKAMASMYSWSSKRSYKNGFVWNDLLENDFIYPTHGHEYVLKGSELLNDEESVNSTSTQVPPPESPISVRTRRNQSWSSHEYKVIRTTESSAKPAAINVSTQTDDKQRRQRRTKGIELEESSVMEIKREEIPPLSSDSSADSCGNRRNVLTSDNPPSGRMKASMVMQLLTCGSISLRRSEGQSGMSLILGYKSGQPYGEDKNEVEKEDTKRKLQNKQLNGRETNKYLISHLKKSSSSNVGRG